MKLIDKIKCGIAATAFLAIVANLSPTANAQNRRSPRRPSFQRIYGQEDTYTRSRRANRQQRRLNRSRLRSLKYSSYHGSPFNYSYGRSGRYGYESYIDRNAYYSLYYRPWYYQSWYYRPWYYAPYSYPLYYRGYYYGYRSYGYHLQYPSYYRGYGFGYAPY